MPNECGLLGDTTNGVVQSGLASLQNYADEAISDVELATQGLSDLIVGLTPIDVDIDIESAGNLSDPFTIGPAPATPNVNFVKPPLTYNPTITIPTFTNTAQDPGTFDKVAPGLNLPDQPADLDAEAPTDVPVVGDYLQPDVPSDEIPPLPALVPIVIPPIPTLVLPEFLATDPGNLTEDAIGVFDWTETPYSGTIQDEVVTQLTEILGGSTGIPDCIWDMIDARARKQLRAAANQSREEAEDYWASRGHFLSNGQLRKRTEEAADTEREGISAIVREMVIQDSKIYVERLNGAIAQGIALEGQLIGLHNGQAQRNLDAAKTIFDIAIQVANLKIAQYNSKMTAYLQKAQVFQVVMQGELAQLEVTKIELEAQALVGQLNLQTLEAYKSQITGITATYDLYAKQVDAVISKYEADKIRVQAFAETVNVYEAQQRAKEVEWRGYAEGVRAQVAVMDGYRIEADAFQSKVQAYGLGVSADNTEFQASLDGEKLKLEKLQRALDQLSTEVQAEAANVDAQIKNNDLDVRVYEAEGRVEQARVSSDAQRLNVLIQNADMQIKAQIQETQMKIQEAQNKLTVQTQGLVAITQAQSSIGSSALAALNYAATIDSSSSNAFSCATNNTYSF